MEPITFDTVRLRLRALRIQDAESVRAACDDPHIARWLPVPSPYTLRDAEEFVTVESTQGWREDRRYNFGVFLRDPQGAEAPLVACTGLVNLVQLAAPHRIAELGFWTAAPHRGNGYVTEASRALVDWAFGGLGVERLEWVAEVGNEASRAVALKLGFRMEGVQRARIVHRGIRRDAWTGALLPSDLELPQTTPYLPAPAPK